MAGVRLGFRVKQVVPQEILDAGTWKAEQLGIPRKQVFRTHRTADLVAEHQAFLAANKEEKVTERPG